MGSIFNIHLMANLCDVFYKDSREKTQKTLRMTCYNNQRVDDDANYNKHRILRRKKRIATWFQHWHKN